MKYIRKSISIFAVLALVFILSFGNVSAGTIYESKTKETVTSGVTLETITRLPMTDGRKSTYSGLTLRTRTSKLTL